MRSALTLAIAVAALPAIVAAEPPPPSPLWEDVAHPNRQLCAAKVDEAKRRIGERSTAAAVPLLEEAAQLCPTSHDVLAQLGAARIELGDLERARAALERAHELDDDDRDALFAFNLGFVRAVAGDLEGSLVEYRRAEELGGLSPERRWLLAFDLGDDYMALGRLGEAIEAYRRAARLAPSEPMPRLALAVALDRNGQLAASRAALRDALRLDGQLLKLRDPQYTFIPRAEVHYYAALGSLARGFVVQARVELRLFLEEVPDGPYSARARELLAELEKR
jgi:Flp pilus assembly protein TadD